MTNPPLNIQRVRFPGRAGQLQQAGDTAGLIAELGDHYGTYHDFLAAELGKVVPFPKGSDFGAGDLSRYLEAWAWIDALLFAEATIRVCRENRKHGSPVQAAPPTTVPALDPYNRLLSIESGQPDAGQQGDPRAAGTGPLAMPDWSRYSGS